MAFVCPNLVFETTTVTGTGAATLLGAVGDFLDFDSQLANLDTVPYTIEFGAVKEVGLGIFSTSGPTLTRTSILFSTNGDAAVDFGAGTKNVYSGIPGELLGSLMDPTGSNGFIAQTDTNTYAHRTLIEGNGITITEESGAGGNPTIGTTFKRVEEFGAVEGVGQETANNAAFALIETHLATTDAAAVVFSEGIWVWDTDINWAQADHTQVIGDGVVRLRNTGTGNSFILDGGATGDGLFNVRVGPFLIEGHDGSGDGVYARSLHHSKLRFNVRGCGTTDAAMRMEWCVANAVNFITSVNEDGGWYNDGSGAAKPLYGLYVDKRTSDSAESAYNAFINPIIEGTSVGCYLAATAGNQFYSGTMEGCTTLGLNVTSAANLNVINGVDFEVNSGGTPDGYDVECGGAQNVFNDIASDSMFKILNGARFNRINSGSFFNIEVESGAVLNVFNQCTYDRHGVEEATFVDNGTKTAWRDLINARLVTIDCAGGRAAYNDDLDDGAESLSGATHLYTNNTGKPVVALISGGLVTRFVLGRPAGTFLTMPAGELSAGSYYLSPLDTIDLDYTSGFPPSLIIRAI